ncbi:MAG: hypothetical protein GF350_09900 [Chitinivibrionales bacterium]|nr:hypothetical protein [Chitinivibrionales bacterium]
MRKCMLMTACLLMPLTLCADSFSFKISIGTPIREWCDDYRDDDLVEVKEVSTVHVFSCGRRVRKHRVIYYSWDRDCYIYSRWHFGAEICGGCSCGHHRKVCYVYTPRRHCAPRRTKHIYIRKNIHRPCSKTTVVHHRRGPCRKKSCTVIHSSPATRHGSSRSIVVKKRRAKPVSSGRIHHATSRAPAKKVTKTTRTNNTVVQLGSNHTTYKSKRIKKW